MEKLSEKNEELSGEFGQFKDVYQKAIVQILQVITSISQSYDQRFKSDSEALSKKVKQDLASLNDQFAHLASLNKDGLNSDNY